MAQTSWLSQFTCTFSFPSYSLPFVTCKLVVNLTINSPMKQSGCTTYQQPPQCWQPFLSMSLHIPSALLWLPPWQGWGLFPMASFETGLRFSRRQEKPRRTEQGPSRTQSQQGRNQSGCGNGPSSSLLEGHIQVHHQPSLPAVLTFPVH